MNSGPFQNSFRLMPYGMEYPFGQITLAVLIPFPSSPLLRALLRMALALCSSACQKPSTSERYQRDVSPRSQT